MVCYQAASSLDRFGLCSKGLTPPKANAAHDRQGKEDTKLAVSRVPKYEYDKAIAYHSEILKPQMAFISKQVVMVVPIHVL